MSHKAKLITEIIFFGAIWGMLEATLGYVLHFIPAFFAGMVMFPIASLILIRAYLRLNSKWALLGIGFIAAMIKSVNLLLPAFGVWKTINPMVSIVFESLLVVGVVSMLVSKNKLMPLMALSIASIGWRVLYIGYMGVQFLLTGFLANHLVNINVAFEFVVISGLISGMIATGLYFLSVWVTQKQKTLLQIKPLLAGLSFILATALTILL